MFKTYAEIRDWLENFISQVYGKEELGLARIEELLKRLGNPERKFKSIHVAGTSGKGSTAFYTVRLLESVSSVLGVSKAKIGLHISPHLVDVRERMQIFSSRHPERSEGSKAKDFSAVPQNDSSIMLISRFLELMSEIKLVVEKVKKEKPELTPSYFEILVAASFLYFAEEKVDWAVIEVGLGGRLDATNVLVPEVTVITNIGLDHTEILGNTIEKIAFEKAGIIKPGVPVVTAAKGKALEVIKKVAREKEASLYVCHPEFSSGSKKILKRVQNDMFRYCTQETAGLAIAAVEVALGKDSGVALLPRMTDRAIEDAFSVGFPGRFEEVQRGVLLDGAHNPDKVRALIQFLNLHYFGEQSDSRIGQIKDSGRARMTGVTLVLAFKKGKDWKTMIDILFEEFSIKEVIATEFQAVTDTGAFAAVSAKEIAEYVKSKWKVEVVSIRNSQEAVFEALMVNGRWKMEDRLIVVTGSLYLVGEVREMWKLFDSD